MRPKSVLFWLGSVLILVGAALLAVYGGNVYRSAEAQKAAKQRLNSPQAIPPAVHRGDVLGELSIPRLHLSVMVFEGDDEGILKIGAGHIPGTALTPGKGNIGIAAHRDTFFRPLRLIHTRDEITLRTPAGTSRFAVTTTEIVPPSRTQVLAPSPGRDLTLVTCYPFIYIGHAPKRFIIHAQRIP